jgi:hypothetical protein
VQRRIIRMRVIIIAEQFIPSEPPRKI